MKFMFAVPMLVTFASVFGFEVAAQTESGPLKTAVLQSRHSSDANVDNYEYATFSFLAGSNGPVAQKLVRNNWDVEFVPRASDGKSKDYFTVAMVVDDRSRIKDLGKLEWTDVTELPELPAYEKPTRDEPVEAKLGHIYYVHTADRDSDHYALFRVEELKAGESVALSWKLLGPSTERLK